MRESMGTRTLPWGDVVEVLHSLLYAIVVRGQYPPGHPAVARADDLAARGFARLASAVPELVVALIDGEFVIAERPLPELRERLPDLAEAMVRHGLDCVVFQRGIELREVAAFADALSKPPAADAVRARDILQSKLPHLLLRYATLGTAGEFQGNRSGFEALVPRVEDLLVILAGAFSRSDRLDQEAVRAVARAIVDPARARSALLQLRSYDPTIDCLAAHTTNVAVMSASMAIEMDLPEAACVEVTAAALVHDVGRLLLPPELRDAPEPMLEDRAKKLYRYHPILGARKLLAAGCPALWVEATLNHHRGMDGYGYPSLETTRPPHDVARIVALANFIDDKRASLHGQHEEPDRALRQCAALSGKYFDARIVGVFERALGIFPPGTTVELSDGETGVVTRVHAGDPLRPEVQLLFGRNAGRRVDLRDFDVDERRFARSIVRAIDPPLATPESLHPPAAEPVEPPDEPDTIETA